MRYRSLTVALFATVAMTTPAGAQVTPGAGSTNPVVRMGVGANVTADADPGDRVPAVNHSNSEQAEYETAASHTVLAYAVASDQLGGGPFASGISSARVDSNFASAASGAFTFSGVSTVNSTADDGSVTTSGGQFADYFFTTLENANFDLTYDFSAATLGCCGNRIELRDLTRSALLLGQTLAGTDTSGSLFAGLLANTAYRLTVTKSQYSFVDSAAIRGIGAQGLVYRDTIKFDIAGLGGGGGGAVPEPASWALLILGFGAIGGALRTRRTSVVLHHA